MINLALIFARTLRARRAANELRQLPDYILKDIGISRGEISFIVAGPDRRTRR